MQRAKGWEQAASAYFRTVLKTPFVRSVHDCCTFPADAIAAMTGAPSLADAFRGTYANEDEANAVLATLGCATVLDLPSYFGLEPIAPGLAQRGDIVAFDGRFGLFLAVQWLPSALAPSRRGLEHIPLTSSPLAAWRVG